MTVRRARHKRTYVNSLKSGALRVADMTPLTRKMIFRRIFKGNRWGDLESVSGKGSNFEQTRLLRAELPRLLAALDIRSMLDVPCGDRKWIQAVDLPLTSYIGGDIIAELIDLHVATAKPGEQFLSLDASRDLLPTVDLIFCRDLLVHLDYETVKDCLRNFRRSGSSWLLTTTFTEVTENADIPTGRWRPLNLERAPFFLPKPTSVLYEGCTEGDGAYADKALALWRLQDLDADRTRA